MILGVYSVENNSWFIAPSWRAAKKVIRKFGMPLKVYRGNCNQCSLLFKRAGVDQEDWREWSSRSFFDLNVVYHSAPEETFITKIKCVHCGYEGTWTDRISAKEDLMEEMKSSPCWSCGKPDAYLEL